MATARSRAVPNFNLVDLQGRNHELRRAEGKIVVLFFTGNGCPIARQSVAKLKALQDWLGHDVTFWLINTYVDDSIEDCRKEYREFMMFPLTYLRDPKQGVASVLGVERTAEVVAINTEDWSIIYQGAIDDQLTEGAQRPSAEHKFLLTALSEFKTGKPISNARTKAHGCRISFNTTAGANAEVTYAAQVALVLRKHCVECHRDGGIGPWPMDSYAHVKDKARMIEEVLLAGQMPPWHADPGYGHWSNDRSLSTEETQTLLQWVAAGAPRGDGSDPLAEPLPALAEWPLGKPDFTVKLPVPEEIPANGVLDYRHITLRLPVTNEVWLAGLDVKPGNLRVVHHVIVRAKSKGGADDGSGQGVMLAGWAPGTLNTKFPAGTGKTIPAKARIDLELHYTTIGTPQIDQTEVAFYLLDHKPERELTTRPAPQLDLNIPPGVDESREAAVYGFAKPATLYTLMPHMHLRGKCMRFELLLPNGERELLLNVPRYDFNWQTIYRFAEPRHVPAGAWLFVTGSFDNSSNNPSNPDPKKRIHFGLQSWDEMFIGFIDAADEPSAAGANTLVGQTPSPGAKANTALLH
jgi:hypothetical protein